MTPTLRRHSVAASATEFEAALLRLDHEVGLVQGSAYEAPGWFERQLRLATAPAVRGDLHGERWTFSALTAVGADIVAHWQRRFGGVRDVHGWHPARSLGARTIDGVREAVVSPLRALPVLLEVFAGQTDDFGWYGVFGPDIWLDGPVERRAGVPEQRRATVFLPLDLWLSSPTATHRLRFEIDGLSRHAASEAAAAGPAAVRSAASRSVVAGGSTGRSTGGRGGAADAVARDAAAADEPADVRPDLERLIERLQRGEAWSATFSRGFLRRFSGSPMQLFARLRQHYPMPVMYALNLGERSWLLGASPGVQARLRQRRLDVMPVCGTVGRGRSPDEDRLKLQSLQQSAKEAASLSIGTDDAIARLSSLCEPGSVELLERRRIHPFATLAHTFDWVRGRLRDDRDAIDVLLGTAGPATVTGVPRQAAWSLITDCERAPRGWYTGAVGRLTREGDLELGTVLRSVQVDGDLVEVRGGGLILARSHADAESDEIVLKARALLDLLTGPASATGAVTQPARGPLGRPADRPAEWTRFCGDPLAVSLSALCASLDIGPAQGIAVLSDAAQLADPPGMQAHGMRRLLVGDAAAAALEALGVSGDALVEQALGDRASIRPLAGDWLDGLPDLDAGDYRRTRFMISGLPASIVPVAVDAIDGSLRAWRDRSGSTVGLLFRPDSVWALAGGVGRTVLQRLGKRLKASG